MYRQKRIIYKIPFVLLLLLAFVSAVFCYDNADYYSYTLIYDYYTPQGLGNSQIVDFGFVALCKLFYSFGCSFVVFRGIYVGVACFNMYKSIQYFTDNSKVPIILYLLFPFALDVVQMRYMFSLSIVIYSLRFLKEGKITKYIIGVIIASTQQLVTVLYLLLIITVLENKKAVKLVKIVFAAELVSFLALSSLLNGFIQDYLLHYNTYLSYSQYSIKLALLYFVMSISLIYLTKAQYSKNTNNDFVTNIILVSILFVPFIFIDENFTRLYRGMIPFVYIGLEKSKRIFYKKSDNLFVAVLYCIVMFYIHLSPHNAYHWEHVFLALFTNNYFWNLFL